MFKPDGLLKVLNILLKKRLSWKHVWFAQMLDEKGVIFISVNHCPVLILF